MANPLLVTSEIFHFDSFPLKHWDIQKSTGFARFVAPIAKTGYLTYYDENTDEFYQEFVPEETLISSADSFKGLPVTLHHPSEKVNSKNAGKYQKGMTHNSIVYTDSGWLWLSGSITDQLTIDSITSGKTDEISCGYDSLVAMSPDTKQRIQRTRVGNHVACVTKARAKGAKFRVDSEDNTIINSFYLKQEFDSDELGDAPEQLYEHYLDPTKPKIFTFRHVDQQLEKKIEDKTKTRLDVRSLLVHKLI